MRIGGKVLIAFPHFDTERGAADVVDAIDADDDGPGEKRPEFGVAGEKRPEFVGAGEKRPELGGVGEERPE